MAHSDKKKDQLSWRGVLANLDIIISGVALVILVAITFVGVIARRFFNSPFAWQEEMQVFCTLWLVYLASGAVFRTIDHISIEIIVDSLNGKIKWVIEILIYLVVMATLAFTLYRSSLLVQQLYTTNRLTNILKIPYFLVYIPLPIGCVLMMISDTITTVDRLFIQRFKKNPNEEAGE